MSDGSREVGFFGAGLVPDATQLQKAAAAAAEETGGGTPYLKMDRRGEWSFGQDNAELDGDDVLAPDPASIRHGYVAWKDGKPHRRLVPLNQSISYSDLEDLGEDEDGNPVKWAKTFSIEFVILTGAYGGTRVQFSNNSNGAQKAFTALFQLMARTSASGEIPLITLDFDTWTSPRYGKIYSPLFVPTGATTTPDGLTEILNGSGDLPPREGEIIEPKAAAQDEPEDDQPRRRRSRRGD